MLNQAHRGCFLNKYFALILANMKFSYFTQAYQELKKVVWPTKDIVRKHTILVLSISIFVSVYFIVLDYLLNQGLEKLL